MYLLLLQVFYMMKVDSHRPLLAILVLGVVRIQNVSTREAVGTDIPTTTKNKNKIHIPQYMLDLYRTQLEEPDLNFNVRGQHLQNANTARSFSSTGIFFLHVL